MYEYKVKVTRVVDGDTVDADINLGFDIVYKERIRLMGIDTPEMKPSRSNPDREAEKEAAYKARNRFIQLATSCQIELDNRSKRRALQELIDTNDKIIDVQCLEFDKYGRLLGEIFINIGSA